VAEARGGTALEPEVVRVTALVGERILLGPAAGGERRLAAALEQESGDRAHEEHGRQEKD
jgi:hypothetical protein